jgi:uncharacterized protein
MRKIALFAILMLLLSFSFAAPACREAVVSVPVPAVVGDGGSILTLEVESRPGDGYIYSATSPRIGVATQTSEVDAATYAFATSGVDRSDCDLLFRVKGSEEDTLVDGPSAGAAMAVAISALLDNKKIRNDIVMTGTIEEGGRVGPVGGIIEKAKAAADMGKKAILTPKQQIYEYLVLSTLATRYDFVSVEVDNVSDAKKIAYAASGTPIKSEFKLKSEPIPSNLTGYGTDSELDKFADVSNTFIDRLENSVENLKIKDDTPGELPRFRDYFRAEVKKYREMVKLGYSYTGANSAFLSAVDVEFLRVGYRDIDLEGSQSDVLSCTKSLVRPEMNGKNLQWVAGADLRAHWAEKKANATDVQNVSGEEKYLALRELLFSQGWCDVARLVYLQGAGIQGKGIDESALSALASERISAADAAAAVSDLDTDAAWHLASAKELEAEGKYAAAIFDATYASSMYKARSEVGATELANATKKVIGHKAKTLWGKIFESQARYILAERGVNFDVYRLLRYSQEIDAVSEKMTQELAAPRKAAETPSNEKEKPEGSETANAQCPPVPAASQFPSSLPFDGPIAAIFLAVFWLLGLGILWRGVRAMRAVKTGP